MSADRGEGRRWIGGRWLRWDPARAAATYVDGHWGRTTLADSLRQTAKETPARTLVTEGDVTLDCATLAARAEVLAQAMLARAPPGGVVSFMLPNWWEAAVIYSAATLAGMVAHPVLPSLRDSELAFMLEDVDSRLLFVPSAFRGHDYVAMMDRVLPSLPAPPEIIVLRGDPGTHTPYNGFSVSEQRRPLPELEPDAVRLVLHTSGTTGRAKAVLHTHNTIHALMRQIGEAWRVGPGDTFLVASPISHIGGSIYAFEAPLMLGSSAVLMDRWDPDAAVRLIDQHACTRIAGATPFLEQLLAAAERARSRLPSLKTFICGGASTPPSLVRRAAAYFESAAVTRVFGSTEVPVTTVGVLDRDDVAHAADTDGRIGVAEVKIADDDGEILVRGPQMFVGYLHAEDDDTAFDADGFFRTGDLGGWVDGTFLVVSGRSKDLIIRNGENISPKEVEDVLIQHPAIAEIAIVSVPDPRTGERACAVIVPKGGAAVDVEALRTYLRERGVAAFKHPEQVVLCEALPKNDAGKVLKHLVRAALSAPTEG